MTHAILDLDLRGQICPACLLLTLKQLNLCSAQIRAGGELRILSDDRQATTTIPAMVQRMGFRAEVTRADGGYRIAISGPG
jgi:TusA-related sulfurtransferase